MNSSYSYGHSVIFVEMRGVKSNRYGGVTAKHPPRMRAVQEDLRQLGHGRADSFRSCHFRHWLSSRRGGHCGGTTGRAIHPHRAQPFSGRACARAFGGDGPPGSSAVGCSGRERHGPGRRSRPGLRVSRVSGRPGRVLVVPLACRASNPRRT